MITRVMGTFEGHSAAMNVGIGFIPDKVQIYSLTDVIVGDWVDMMSRNQAVDNAGGFVSSAGSDSLLALGSGVRIFRGGATITTAAETDKVKDPSPDKSEEGAGVKIDTWTLGNSGNRTGNWNAVCNTTYVDSGSEITIDGKVYFITALSSNGEAANEVTLSEAVKSGTITQLTARHSFIAAIAGTIMPAGFTVATGELNTDSETLVFIAEHS